MQHAIDVAPFDELADPRVLAELAAAAEERGWDGFFLWDHIAYRPPVQALADPWVAMAAVAAATSRVAIGPMVTPVSRRRALNWDGYCPVGLPGPEALADLAGQIQAERPGGRPFDVIAYLTPGDDPGPWARARATWSLTDFGSHPGLARVREVIAAGPPSASPPTAD